jgi:hypothetical protein
MIHDLSTQKGRNEYVKAIEKKPIRKPKFFQAVLQPIKGDVLEHVYHKNHGMTLTERMGSEEAKCGECSNNEWILLAGDSCAVREGGKPYMECMNCGTITHL